MELSLNVDLNARGFVRDRKKEIRQLAEDLRKAWL